MEEIKEVLDTKSNSDFDGEDYNVAELIKEIDSDLELMDNLTEEEALDKIAAILDSVDDKEEILKTLQEHYDEDEDNYKAIELLVPSDTEVISVTVVRNQHNPETGRETAIVASCFPAYVDVHDCLTGYSYRQDENGKLYLLLDSDEDYEEVDISPNTSTVNESILDEQKAEFAEINFDN